MDLSGIIARLRSHPGEPSITITTNAAHTYMDAGLVREHLKGLQHAAEQLIRGHYDKRIAQPVIERSRRLVQDVHTVNGMPGLAMFVNAEIAEAVHLPFLVSEGVTVGSSFHMRDLLRTGLESTTYHVLVLSRDLARLYQAADDQFVREVRNPFPLRNRHHTTDAMQLTTARGRDNQERRFNHEVHEAVRNAVGKSGPVVLACVVERQGAFLNTVGHDPLYQGHLHGNFEHTFPEEVITRAWQLVNASRVQRQLDELERASNGPVSRFTTAVEDVWAAVTIGRGQVLFVERDRQQAALLEDDQIQLLPEGADHQPGFDLVDQIIEEQLAHGGQVRMLPNGSMHRYKGLALKLRYG